MSIAVRIVWAIAMFLWGLESMAVLSVTWGLAYVKPWWLDLLLCPMVFLQAVYAWAHFVEAIRNLRVAKP